MEIMKLIKIKNFLENNNEKIYVKIISPNFDLKYGLKKKKLKKD